MKNTPSPIDDLQAQITADSRRSTECPRCHQAHIVRSGYVQGRQRYQCQDCQYHYTTGRRGKSPAVKRMAVHLYLEGLGFRAIGRFLGVSNVSVLNWIYQYAEQLDPIRKPEDGTIEIVEIDEMFSFI
ncbi:MAG TPA: hypothetical protein VFD13_06080, partial [Candidatus Kapabacteria bacterium]|nr:hypothetical protein [Candidatus Kapabacteria bacterium]